jgi:hypothetical protein
MHGKPGTFDAAVAFTLERVRDEPLSERLV